MLMKFNEFMFLESVDPFSGRPLKLCTNSINTCCLCHERYIFYIYTQTLSSILL
jgi:hypothetical protein